MTCSATTSAAAPASARRRAGPAWRTGVASVATAPALAAAPAANRNGSSRRASCQTGIAVAPSSAPV